MAQPCLFSIGKDPGRPRPFCSSSPVVWATRRHWCGMDLQRRTSDGWTPHLRGEHSDGAPLSQGRAAMLQMSRVGVPPLTCLATTRPGLIARLRLFSLLSLIVAVFTGLQLVIAEGTPKVEVRVIPRDVPVEVPVQVFVERIVERVVYVPVPMASAEALPPAMRAAVQSLQGGLAVGQPSRAGASTPTSLDEPFELAGPAGVLASAGVDAQVANITVPGLG